jgi:DNA-3-methyladenine glycosylase
MNEYMEKMGRSFFYQNAYDLARGLLGKIIRMEKEKGISFYRIVETEAYGGISDKAAHSYNDTHTKRTDVMYGEGGQLYIYLIYGMYSMLNIVASIPGNPEAVLVRAIEPLEKNGNRMTTNGPGKLCKSLGIDRSENGLDLCTSEKMCIMDDGYVVKDLVCTKRINVDYAQEDMERLWRFYIKDNPFVSKK